MKQIPFPHQFCIFNLPPNIHSVLSTPGRRAFGLSRRVFCRSFALTSAHSTSPSSPLSRYPNRCMHAPATHTTRHQSNQQHLLLQSGTLSPHLALSPASHQTHFSHQSPSSQHHSIPSRYAGALSRYLVGYLGCKELPRYHKTTTGTNAAIEISASPRPPPSPSTTPLASPIAVRPA
jgi:hypothetical protein